MHFPSPGKGNLATEKDCRGYAKAYSLHVMSKPTYAEIAADFTLWGQYADTEGYDTKEAFDSETVEAKVAFQIRCFGPEQPEATEAE